jgi:hypothetical protein
VNLRDDADNNCNGENIFWGIEFNNEKNMLFSKIKT